MNRRESPGAGGFEAFEAELAAILDALLAPSDAQIGAGLQRGVEQLSRIGPQCAAWLYARDLAADRFQVVAASGRAPDPPPVWPAVRSLGLLRTALDRQSHLELEAQPPSLRTELRLPNAGWLIPLVGEVGTALGWLILHLPRDSTRRWQPTPARRQLIAGTFTSALQRRERILTLDRLRRERDALFGQDGIGLAIVDRSGHWWTANTYLAHLLEADPDGLMAYPFFAWFPPTERETLRGVFDGLATGPHRRRVDWALSLGTGSGATRRLKLSAAPAWPSGTAEPVFVLVLTEAPEPFPSATRAEPHLKPELLPWQQTSATVELAAALIHQLRQPLSTLGWNHHTLERWLARNELLDAFGMDLVGDIGEGVQHIQAIVDHLEAFFVRHELHLTELWVRETLESVLPLIQHRLDAAGITVQLEGPRAAARVRGDRIQLQLVWINLLSNAIEALESTASANRRIRCAFDPLHRGFMIVTIGDNGDGLTDEAQRRGCEALFSTKEGGMGIGLALSRAILRAHGGRLRLVEAEDETRVECHLPRHPPLVPVHSDEAEHTTDAPRSAI